MWGRREEREWSRWDRKCRKWEWNCRKYREECREGSSAVQRTRLKKILIMLLLLIVIKTMMIVMLLGERLFGCPGTRPRTPGTDFRRCNVRTLKRTADRLLRSNRLPACSCYRPQCCRPRTWHIHYFHRRGRSGWPSLRQSQQRRGPSPGDSRSSWGERCRQGREDTLPRWDCSPWDRKDRRKDWKNRWGREADSWADTRRSGPSGTQPSKIGSPEQCSKSSATDILTKTSTGWQT